MTTNGTRQLDETFSLLSDSRRRYLLYHLAAEDGPVDVTDLARALAEWEAKGTDSETGVDGVAQVLAALHHSHLPKLVDTGIVSFSRDIELVTLADADLLDPFLDIAERVECTQLAADD